MEDDRSGKHVGLRAPHSAVKRLSTAIGSRVGGVAGQLFFFTALFVAIAVYQQRQGHLVQAAVRF